MQLAVTLSNPKFSVNTLVFCKALRKGSKMAKPAARLRALPALQRLTAKASLRLQIFVEVIDGALPGEFGRGLVIARRRVVVKPVVGLGINVSLVFDRILVERLFVFGPTPQHARVLLGEVEYHRRFDFGHVRGCRSRA